MKTKDNSKKSDEDKYQDGHENQNIRDFNLSQYVEEEDEVEKKEDKTEKTEKKSDKKKNE